MARVFIPQTLRSRTHGIQEVQLEGQTVRSLIAALDQQFPGIGEQLCTADALRTGLSVSIDGRVTSLGLYQRVGPDSEVHFIPAIGGG